jgi:hypothetical protein
MKVKYFVPILIVIAYLIYWLDFPAKKARDIAFAMSELKNMPIRLKLT